MSSIKYLLLLLFIWLLSACGQKGALVLEQESSPASEEIKQLDTEIQKTITKSSQESEQ